MFISWGSVSASPAVSDWDDRSSLNGPVWMPLTAPSSGRSSSRRVRSGLMVGVNWSVLTM